MSRANWIRGKLSFMMVRALGFVIVRRALGLVGLGPNPDAKDMEIAVLRHKLMVLRRRRAAAVRPDRSPGTKRIADIQVGDLAWATDPETREPGRRRVTALIVGEGQKALVEITVADGDPEAPAEIVATAEHPFWSADPHAWIDAKELRLGYTP